MLAAQNISISIQTPFQQAYDFISKPENFPKWASGLCSAIQKQGDDWIAETPTGRMKVRFTEPNRFGVLDHSVIGDSGEEINIPMRLIRNGQGCELILTLFRLPGVGDEQFQKDIEWVKRDLLAIKHLLEGMANAAS